LTAPDRRREGLPELSYDRIAVAVTLVVTAVLLLLLVRAVWDLLTSASPQLASSIVSAGGIVLVAVLSAILSKRAEQRREIEQEQRAKKAQVYEAFLSHWFAVMRGVREELPEDERKEMDDNYYGSVPPQMVAWASEAVLREYAAHAAPLGSEDEEGSIFDFERVLFAIRKDLGHSNEGLQRGDLMRLFLTGVDELLEEVRRSAAS
jgi:hypothetical protein